MIILHNLAVSQLLHSYFFGPLSYTLQIWIGGYGCIIPFSLFVLVLPFLFGICWGPYILTSLPTWCYCWSWDSRAVSFFAAWWVLVGNHCDEFVWSQYDGQIWKFPFPFAGTNSNPHLMHLLRLPSWVLIPVCIFNSGDPCGFSAAFLWGTAMPTSPSDSSSILPRKRKSARKVGAKRTVL